MTRTAIPPNGHWNQTATTVGLKPPPPEARPPNEQAGDSHLAQRAGLRRPPKGERRVDLSQNGYSLSLSLSLLCFAPGLRCGQAPHPAHVAHPLHHSVGGARLCKGVCGLSVRLVLTPPWRQVHTQHATTSASKQHFSKVAVCLPRCVSLSAPARN